LSYFLTAYKINPRNKKTITNIAKIYQINKKHREAIFYFNKLLKIEPENLDCLNDLAISLNEIGEKEKAIKILKYILKKNPDYKPAEINLRIIQKIK
jgi:tetratricopeptide (TPR) repeat protein